VSSVVSYVLALFIEFFTLPDESCLPLFWRRPLEAGVKVQKGAIRAG
jgi:hypothetical protein